jgi:predicted rRNA methylase YqxC with S4 and FtsJ domains
VDAVAEAARALGLEPVGRIPSPITGAKGNVEYLLHLRAAAGGTQA